MSIMTTSSERTCKFTKAVHRSILIGWDGWCPPGTNGALDMEPGDRILTVTMFAYNVRGYQFLTYVEGKGLVEDKEMELVRQPREGSWVKTVDPKLELPAEVEGWLIFNPLGAVMPRITSAVIKSTRCEREVYVTLDNGTERLLFSYFPDELSFSEHEFVGLTEREGLDLHTRKDVAYLRS